MLRMVIEKYVVAVGAKPRVGAQEFLDQVKGRAPHATDITNLNTPPDGGKLSRENSLNGNGKGHAGLNSCRR